MAASSNFVSQSYVSQQIKKVEETFGHKLVQREKRSLKLKPAGGYSTEGVGEKMEKLRPRGRSFPPSVRLALKPYALEQDSNAVEGIQHKR